jgi:hypothetical protein
MVALIPSVFPLLPPLRSKRAIMSDEENSSPPDYLASTKRKGLKGLETPPPEYYGTPSSFRISAHTLDTPLVTSKDMLLHLSLLRAFYRLRMRVEDERLWRDAVESPHGLEASRLDGPQRWSWFISLTMER